MFSLVTRLQRKSLYSQAMAISEERGKKPWFDELEDDSTKLQEKQLIEMNGETVYNNLRPDGCYELLRVEVSP